MVDLENKSGDLSRLTAARVRAVAIVREVAARVREVARASPAVLLASTHSLVGCTDGWMVTRIHLSGINPMGRAELSVGGRQVDFFV